MVHHSFPTLPAVPGTTPDDDQFQLIHNATMAILSKRGMRIGCPELVQLAKRRGVRSQGDILLFTEDQVLDAVSSTTSVFTLMARNPSHSIDFDLDRVAYGMGRAAPFVMMPAGQRRVATRNDFVEMIQLGQMLDPVSLAGTLAYPGDLPVDAMYPFMMAAQVLYTDKPYNVSRAEDLQLLCRAFGISESELTRSREVVYGQSTVNTLSPLALAGDQGRLLMDLARSNIAVSISPCPSAGMTGPCSVMGNVVLNNCEVLGTLVLAQMIQPGLPVFYGAFPCGTDMRSMCVTIGGPESRIMTDMASGMAKRYGLLTRANVGMNDAQECDFHAGAESMFNFINATRDRVNFLPGCGILAGFASASREKLIMDAQLAEYVTRYDAYQIQRTDTLDEIIDLILNLGPHDSFITMPHTLNGFKTELFHPRFFTRVSYDKWSALNRNLVHQASDRADHMLKMYEQPELDVDLKQELESVCVVS